MLAVEKFFNYCFSISYFNKNDEESLKEKYNNMLIIFDKNIKVWYIYINTVYKN